MDHSIKLEFLDHVAIHVKDLKTSIKWYSEVLGLKEYKVKEWGEYPIFMLSGQFGLALFPAKEDGNSDQKGSVNIRIDHFAFRVDEANFALAIGKYQNLGLKFNIQDHVYFESVYTRDPDGHIVELTRLKVDPKDFYK